MLASGGVPLSYFNYGKDIQMEDSEQKLRALIAKHLDIDVSKIVDDARMIDDLGADSLDTVELIMEIEEKYGLEISDQDALRLVTVGDCIKYVQENATC